MKKVILYFFGTGANGYFRGAMMRAFKPLFGVFSSTPYHGGLPGWIWDNFQSIPPTLGSPEAKVLRIFEGGYIGSLWELLGLFRPKIDDF